MSKQTPNSDTAKTASAPNLWRVGLIVLAGAVVVVLVALHGGAQTARLQTPRATFSLAIADTDAARHKGLGGRTSMPANQGMLFEFGVPSNECFWMKDMRFALDMVWLDSSKRVIQVRPNLSPATYPQTFCAPNTKYVVELNAGQAARAGIALGQQLSF